MANLHSGPSTGRLVRSARNGGRFRDEGVTDERVRAIRDSMKFGSATIMGEQ